MICSILPSASRHLQANCSRVKLSDFKYENKVEKVISKLKD